MVIKNTNEEMSKNIDGSKYIDSCNTFNIVQVPSPEITARYIDVSNGFFEWLNQFLKYKNR